MLRPYEAIPGQTIDSVSLAETAMDLHYPRWYILGREESDLPERIWEHDTYILDAIPKLARPDHIFRGLRIPGWESEYDFDEDKTQEIADKIQDTGSYPPVIFDDGMEIIDGWHRAWAVLEILGESFIWGWVPQH